MLSDRKAPQSLKRVALQTIQMIIFPNINAFHTPMVPTKYPAGHNMQEVAPSDSSCQRVQSQER